MASGNRISIELILNDLASGALKLFEKSLQNLNRRALRILSRNFGKLQRGAVKALEKVGDSANLLAKGAIKTLDLALRRLNRNAVRTLNRHLTKISYSAKVVSNSFQRMGDASMVAASKMKRTGDAVTQTDTTFSKLRNSFLKFLALYASFQTFQTVFVDFVKTVAETQQLNTRLSALTDASYELVETQEYLTQTANRLSVDINALGESYAGLLTLEQSGLITTKDARDILEGFANVAAKTGATSEQLKQSLFGLSQGLSAGTLRAEELNQVTEPLPGLLQQLDNAAGLPAGGFRKLVVAGKVTSEMLRVTLIEALSSYQGSAKATTNNLSSLFTRLNNNYIALKGAMETPISVMLTPLLNFLIKKLKEFENLAKQNGRTLNQQAALIGAGLVKIAGALIWLGKWIGKISIAIITFVADNKLLILILATLYFSLKLIFGILKAIALLKLIGIILNVTGLGKALLFVGAGLKTLILGATGASTILGALNVVILATTRLLIALAFTPIGAALVALSVGFYAISKAASKSSEELEKAHVKMKRTMDLLKKFRTALAETKERGFNKDTITNIERLRAAVMSGRIEEKKGVDMLERFINKVRANAHEQEQIQQQINIKQQQYNEKQKELAQVKAQIQVELEKAKANEIKAIQNIEIENARKSLDEVLNGKRLANSEIINLARLSAAERIKLEQRATQRIKDLNRSIADEQRTLTDKIRELRRREMGEVNAQADLELEIQEKLTKAKEAIAPGKGITSEDINNAVELARQAETLAGGLDNTDKAVKTLESVSKIVKQALQDNVEQVQFLKAELQKEVKTSEELKVAPKQLKIEADISQADIEIDILKFKLAELKDKTINVKINQVEGHNAGGIVGLGLARGGRVPGAGNTDTVPALLTPGEFVIKKSRAQQFRQLLNLINYAPARLVQQAFQQPIMQPALASGLNIAIPQVPRLTYADGGLVRTTTTAPVETVKFEWHIGQREGTMETLMGQRQQLNELVDAISEASRGL